MCDKAPLVMGYLSHNDSNGEHGVPMLLMGSARQTSERSRSDELGGIALQPPQNADRTPVLRLVDSVSARPPVRTLLAGSAERQAR